MHEIAFEIGSLRVHWYGILVAAGFFAAYWTATRRGRRDGLSAESIADVTFFLFLGALVGARLLYVLTFWREEFAGRPLWNIFAGRSGFVFYGGLIGATAAGVAYARRKQLPVWKLADALAPSVALGHFFGRLGCLMTGCCFGRVCDLPWAIRFPEHHSTGGVPVHPTQLYEAGLNLVLYSTLAWWYRRKQFDGQVFALYLLAYALLRAVVESFRGDYPTGKLTGWLTPGQFVSVGILGAGVALYRWRRRVHRPATTPALLA